MALEEDDFEKPLRDLEKKIEELSGVPGGEDRSDDLVRLQRRLESMRQDVYARLTPWQRTLVARHPRRPYTLDYVQLLFSDFREIHGDRKYADDPAIVAGFALYKGEPVIVLGHQKGRDTREKVRRNFGMPRPEGYRKAVRVMELAEKFGRPIFTFVDTPGAYPGRGAEERGQAEAIAHSLRVMSRLRVPIVVTVTGEGGSGGALAIAIGDRILMLEHSVYSVISPEGCAAILWSDQSKAREAARSMRMTAPDLRELEIIDDIVPEPPGGAQADPSRQAQILDDYLSGALADLISRPSEERVEARYRKFRRMGKFGQAKFF
ncbi:MAG TPA: acetyl-CoA carboxylase carboxyltransferase subunit alpha [Candidatus Polarisedimenticolia bacterium]|jgi:acetyl-CoA carboxylase carboxyl transferase subunit alpha|nr:acetyl-CoA carboxylase carboxyltransferase subunit alpha [Candidatus Polarisedimenticolia bacterium]